MLFSELNEISYDDFRKGAYTKPCLVSDCGCEEEYSEILEIDSISRILKNTPYCVAKQFYLDHGKNDNFQELYSDINIMGLNWRLDSVAAGIICDASINPNFEEYTSYAQINVCEYFNSNSLGMKKIAEYWRKNKTWMTPPIFLKRNIDIKLLPKNRRDLHLVEGHTRVGMLRGLIDKGLFSEEYVHKIWVGY